MEENETFDKFNTKLTEIVNKMWALGEPILEGKNMQ